MKTRPLHARGHCHQFCLRDNLRRSEVESTFSSFGVRIDRCIHPPQPPHCLKDNNHLPEEEQHYSQVYYQQSQNRREQN